MTLSTKIFLGLGLGVATGLFFGEPIAFLEPVGDAFVQLLKMAVLPYITVSLITGLGSLDPRQAKTLFVRVGGLVVLIWATTFVVLFAIPLTFPQWQSASFFSTTLLQETEPFDFLRFIPENPFSSLANTIVPAVVLFCIAVGLALMGIENKQNLLKNLQILTEALSRVMKFVLRLTPYGVFAIAASAAGTMRLEELGKIQVYILTFSGAALLMTFVVLPALVTVMTPVGFGEVLARGKAALVTAFATDNLLVVLPLLADQSKEIAEDNGLSAEESGSAVDVIVPVSFNFPHAGKILQLCFVYFAAWFTETMISLTSHIQLAVTALFSFFGKPVIALPFLLDLVRVPADMFQLYLASGVLVARFGTLVAVMNTLVLAVLGAFAMAGKITFGWTRLIRSTAIAGGIAVVWLVATRMFFANVLVQPSDSGKVLAQMEVVDTQAGAKVYETAAPVLDEDLSQPVMTRIQQRGFMRVGYITERLPFAFFNGAGDLVGFDIAMAHKLAYQIGVGLEFVPLFDVTHIAAALDRGDCDIVMSDIALTPERSQTMGLSIAYLEMTLAFVVRDHLRADFSSLETLRALEKPRIAVVHDVPYYRTKVGEIAPNAELIEIVNSEEFFEDPEARFDAFAFTAEIGSAYTLRHPQYAVAIPRPSIVQIPVIYPVASKEQEFLSYLNAWIGLKKKDGTIDGLYDYWILGKGAVRQERRWSVLGDMLGWK